MSGRGPGLVEPRPGPGAGCAPLAGAATPDGGPPWGRKRGGGAARRRLLDRTIRRLLLGAAATAILAVALIFVFLAREGLPALAEVPLANLLGTRWQPTSSVEKAFGLLPLLNGTLLVTVCAIGLALPFGVGGALYLAEFARPAERELLKPLLELLAAVPSVVLGFFGLVVVGPAIKQLFGLADGLNALTGGVLLALMATPTILSIAEDALRAVPASYREASLALGASAWTTTWRVVLPAAAPGVLAAVLLGFGRAIGETMAVLMVTGNAAQLTLSPLESVRTMTATIANEMGEVVYGDTHYHVLFLVGLVLLAMTLAVNLGARRLLVRRADSRTR
ncbi:MAG: phosphate ABC transporter permease subunit PstC [Planctomycetota bacterium]|nr:MAG: phosphate ABC transporter permease subunit PstC [Planctomycetota bacterium]